MTRYPGTANTRPPAYWWAIRLLYNLSFPIALLLLLPSHLMRMIRRGSYRSNFGERLARYSPEVKNRLQNGHWVWMHAVSVGEVLIALKLAKVMRQHQPEIQVVLSTTTATGRSTARAANLDWVQLIYNPLDFSPFIRRALSLIRPRALILVEAEVWPNLVSEAQVRGIPIALVNARVSPRSEKRYRAARAFVAPLFNQLDMICVQEEEDEQKWKSFGVRQVKIHCPGSIKFDDLGKGPVPERPEFRQILTDLGISQDAPVLLGASTHPGEEKILADIAARLRTRYPDLLLLLVPRHVERRDEIVTELTAAGYDVRLRSSPTTASTERPAILIVDTTGELREWYTFGTVVFVGKSLTVQGGHNPLEPISGGKPVLFGPHMHNFAGMQRRLVEAGATLPIQTPDDLETAVAELLANPAKREELVARASRILERHRGATERTRELLALQ